MVRRLGDHLETSHLNKYLSPTIGNKTNGKLASGQRIKNLTKIACVKLNRILHAISTLLSGGEWINNKSVAKKIYKNITKITNDLSDSNQVNLVQIKNDISQIYEILRLLRKSGLNEEVVQNLEELTQLTENDLPKLPEKNNKLDFEAVEGSGEIELENRIGKLPILDIKSQLVRLHSLLDESERKLRLVNTVEDKEKSVKEIQQEWIWIKHHRRVLENSVEKLNLSFNKLDQRIRVVEELALQQIHFLESS